MVVNVKEEIGNEGDNMSSSLDLKTNKSKAYRTILSRIVWLICFYVLLQVLDTNYLSCKLISLIKSYISCKYFLFQSSVKMKRYPLL